MQKYAIKSSKSYTKNGEQKTIWLGIGTLTIMDDGKIFVELNMTPEQRYMAFPLDEKPREAPKADIELSDIPF